MSKLLVLVPSNLEAQVLSDLPLDIHLIGVGPVEAAISAYEIFLEKKPFLAFLTGFAGAYPGSDLKVGSVIVATCEKFVDLGRKYETHFTPLPEHLSALNCCFLNHVYTEKLIYLLEINGFFPQVGPLATVCSASFDVKRAKFIEKKFQVLAENMEGFGVAFSAKKLKVYLLEVRIISNLLKEPEKKWEIEKVSQVLREVWKCIVQNWK